MNLPPRHEIQAERCRRNFFYFVQTFWDEIIREKPVYNWHIEFLCDELQKIGFLIRDRKEVEYDTIINVPPNSTKSTICSQMFPAWLWVIDSSISVLTGSHSMSLATRDSVKSRDIIRSDKFKLMFPHIVIKMDNDGKTEYSNTNTGLRVALSVGGGIGRHGHVIIVDDPLNPQSTPSDAEIKSANEWTDWVSTTRVIDTKVSAFILVMQRLNQNDPTGMMLTNPSRVINHICLPAELTNDVKPEYVRDRYQSGYLDPDRLGPDQLAKKRTGIGSLGYAGQYLQTPLPPEGSIIKKDWFKTCTRQEFMTMLNGTVPNMNYYLDTAYTDEKRNDPTGIIGTCFEFGQLYIVDAVSVWKEFPELLKFIPQFVERNGADRRTRIVIEPKASGKSIAPQLKQNTLYNVYYSKPPVDSKISRVNSVSPFIESGRVTIVEGEWNREFLEEVCTFPNAKHDEMADVLVMAIDDALKAVNRKAIY